MNHTVIDIKDPVIKSVIHKIASRSNVGVAKYGTTLAESNRRSCSIPNSLARGVDGCY